MIALAASGCWRAVYPDATFLQIREEMRRGQLDASLHDVDAALAKYQRRNPEWAARFRVQKAHILMLRGSYSESLQLLNEPLPPSLTRTDAEVQRKMVQGLAHDYLQEFEPADHAISEAENLAAAIHSSLLGDVAQARGIVEIDQKNYPKAATAFRTAAAIARDRNLPRAELNALANLGNVAMWQEHYDEALDRFKGALEKSRLVGAVSAEAKTLGNLGWNYSVVGDFENAEAFLAEAQSKSAQAGLVVDQIRWLNSLAGVYAQEGRYPEADLTGQKALALAKSQDDKRLLTECLNTASEIALATGRLDDAEKFNREAMDVENAGLDQFGIASSTIINGRIAASKGQNRTAESAFQKIIGDRAVETPLLWEAQAGLAQVHAAQDKAVLAEREFRDSIGTITNAWDAVEHEEFRLSFLSSAIRFYDAYVKFLIAQKRPLDALEVAERSRAQTLEHGLPFSANGGTNGATRLVKSGKMSGPAQTVAFRPQEISRRLSATLLFYWLGQERSWLWVITPAKVTLLPLPAGTQIDAAVKSYRESFLDPRDPLEAGNADGKKLYDTLVRPAEKLIRKNSRVIILPDGSLNSLNFETLLVSEPRPHYWIEDVTLLTANSLSLLSRTSFSAPPKSANLLLIGNALPASPDFPPLPQAGKEIGLLEKYFPDSQRSVLTGAQATASGFLGSKPEQFSYLHFATHGTASRLRPLESAVILSPEGDSFKLYARDIVQYPLHAYLVTISACNGAGMRTYAGEGLVGLSWAFLRAGAHNVIAALWEVSDASTPQLMDALYGELSQGKDPATALRDAKLSLLHSSDANSVFKKPFYWAPFQLYAGS